MSDTLNFLREYISPKPNIDYGQYSFLLTHSTNDSLLLFKIVLVILSYMLILYLSSMMWIPVKEFNTWFVTDFSVLGHFLWAPISAIEIFNEFIMSKIPGGYNAIIKSTTQCADPLSAQKLAKKCSALYPPTTQKNQDQPAEIAKWWAIAPYVPYNMAAVDIDNTIDEFTNMDTNTWTNSWTNSWTKNVMPIIEYIKSTIKRMVLLLYLKKGAITSTQKLKFVSQ